MIDFRESRVYKAVNHLDKGQKGQFRKWLSSPFMIAQDGKREIVVRYFDKLLHHQAHTAQKLISESDMFRLVFPDPEKPFMQNYFRTLSTELVNQLFQFITWLHFQDAPNQVEIHLQSAMLRFGFEKDYLSRYKRLKKTSPPRVQMDDDWSYYNFKSAHLHTVFEGNQSRRVSDNNLGETLQGLEEFYQYEKLKLHCLKINRELSLGEAAPEEVDAIRQHAQAFLTSKTPLIRCYALVCLTLTTPENRAHYDQLKLDLESVKGEFSSEIMLDFYRYQLNYCARRVSEAKREFLEETCELYETLLQGGLLQDSKGRLHINYYKNIATIYAELAWQDRDPSRLAAFLSQYKNRLAGDVKARKVAITLGKSILDLIQKNYATAISGFNEVLGSKTVVDWFFLMAGRVFMIQALYERDEFRDDETLQSFIKSTAQFIKYHHKGIAQVHQTRFMNFLKSAQTLKEARILPESKRKRDKIQRLSHRVSTEKFIVSRTWLLDMIAKSPGTL